MGNWFSNTNAEPLNTRQVEVSQQRYTQRVLRPSLFESVERVQNQHQRETQNVAIAVNKTRTYEIIPERPPIPRPQSVLINYILNLTTIDHWTPMNCNMVLYVKIPEHSVEYSEIKNLFKNSNKKFFKISEIERIQNPYLYGTYLLKKEELESRFGYSQEKLLFHGTKKQNVENICNDNFDWRRHGRGTGHRFGKGVSFTPISNYATHYCDKHHYSKIMLVAKVLISNSCIGNGEMMLPPNGYDTTQKDDGHVIVKYEDNEFYPAYKIHFFRTV